MGIRYETCVLVCIFFSLGYCGTLKVFTDVSLSWSDARSICVSEGMDLVIVEDNAEMKRVNACVTNNGGFLRDCWIGGYFDDLNSELRWVDNTIIPLTHPDWATNEPNCLPGTESIYCETIEDCVRVSTALKLKSMTCTKSFDVICEASDGTQNCISPLTTSMHHVPPSNKKTLSTGAIIGLVLGFVSFILTVALCCCIWKTFCGISEEDKVAPDPDGIHNVNLSEAACHQIATENPWLKHEEVSFCLRNKYTFETKETTLGTRSKYIK